jgi:hypothetical protein
MKLPSRLRPNLANAPRVICEHFLGENHTYGHRIFVGSFIMIFGVSIAQAHVGIVFVDMFFEGAGYVIHAIGAVPILEYVNFYRSNK